MLPRILDFTHALRAAGVPVAISEDIDAMRALAHIPAEDKEAFRASLATTMAGLEVNRTRGDARRFELWEKTHTILETLRHLGIFTPNRSGYPIVEIPLADHEEIDEVGRYLFDKGIYVTLAAYPLVPKNEVGFRIQVTASNKDDEIEELISVLSSLKEHFQLHQTVATV